MKNELTNTLQISYPIVQAPMLGVTTPEMVAAVSNAGGLGSLPVGGVSPEVALSLIQKTKALTTQPFAVNLFCHAIPNIAEQEIEAMQHFLAALCASNGLPYERKSKDSFRHFSYRDQLDILLQEKVPIVSFTFGILDDESIQAFKSKGVVLIGTATSVKEALYLEAKGIDIITAQGTEAGGHRGTFLEHETLPLIGIMSLVSLITSQISTPVLAAGGLHDGKGIKAALVLGAQGVQLGTAFIASHESAAIPSYKAALLNASETDIVLTNAFSGRWARGLVNTFIKEVENAGLAIPHYPYQNSLSSPIRLAAQKTDNHHFTTLWAGQSAAKISTGTCKDILERLVQQSSFE